MIKSRYQNDIRYPSNIDIRKDEDLDDR